MEKYKKGLPWLRIEKYAPRLFLNEKNEKIVKWVIRGITIFGVAASVISLPWYYALLLAITLVLIDAFLEKTIFYYTSMYLTAMPDFEYDPDKWIANCFLSLGPPDDPESEKVVGLVFDDDEYASNFFGLLRAWNHDSSDNEGHNFNLSFIIDEDSYYVYLYPSFEKESIKNMHREVEEEFKLTKYGKEHFGLIMALVICKQFSATHGFGLGMLIDHHPEDKPFMLGAFRPSSGQYPEPIPDIQPIKMYGYKARIPNELTDKDFEKTHWFNMVDRRAIGENA